MAELKDLAKTVERISREGELRAGLAHLKEVTKPDGTKILKIVMPPWNSRPNS